MVSKEPAVGQDTNPSDPPKRGRPYKFQSVAELQKAIDAYFTECDPHPVKAIEYKWHEIEENYETVEKGKPVQRTRMVNDYSRLPEQIEHYVISQREPYSITGLAMALDTSRRTLLDYEKGIVDLENMSEDEVTLFNDLTHTIKKAKRKIEHDVQRRLESNAVVGTIFNLKNNFDWIDRTIEDGTQEVVVTTRKHANGNT